MTQTIDIAIVGASGVVGEAMVAALAESEIPVGKLHLLASDRSLGKKLEFRDRYLPIEAVDGFDFGRVRLALFAASPAVAADFAPKASAAGVYVIDTSGHFSERPDVPLIVPEVNAHALAKLSAGAIIASPGALSVQLAVTLKPLASAGLERVHVASYEAVSALGKEALEELATQTANLLNLREAKPKRFARQIAFNVLARVDAAGPDGHTAAERALVYELRRLLESPELMISPTRVRVPVFYGHGAAVHIETARKLDAGTARELLEKAPGIKVLDDPSDLGYPTPVTEASQNDEVFVGRIREDISQPRGLNFWIVADNVRKGAALNSVQVAERLIRDQLLGHAGGV